MHNTVRAGLLLAMAALPLRVAKADGLAGSPSSMVHQHEIAVKEDYTFLRTPGDVRHLADLGGLVPVTEGENVALSKVSYPFARPEVRSFIEHFAARYREATGDRLVVTSLTRPEALQPANAHKLSVHPAGMALDLRIPADGASRAWVERTLLEMEHDGLLDVTREKHPAHYHIAVFAEAYRLYAARQDSLAAIERARVDAERRLAAARADSVAAASSPAERPSVPAFLFGMVALVGMTAPVMYRASRSRIRTPGDA